MEPQLAVQADGGFLRGGRVEDQTADSVEPAPVDGNLYQPGTDPLSPHVF